VSEHDLGGGLANQPGDDPALSRALRERLGRYAASPRLRAAVRESLEPPPSPRRWSGWLAPALTAATTALVMVGWLAGTLPTSVGGDPLRDLARAVITEHARTLSWSPAEPNVIPAALPRAMDESGVTLNWVFAGDNELQLINAHPTYVESHRGLSLVYQDAQGHAVTYVIFPGAATVAMPEAERVRIEQWRPVIRKENGFSLIMWKQQGLFCVLVADLVSDDDLARLKQHFIKVRSATDLVYSRQ
jgi:anti-sigma factor RsiW